MKLSNRGGLSVIVVAGAALVAAGCGGSGSGSSAASAASGATALDLVPKDAIAYATIDTNFGGSNWKRFDDLAKAFDANFSGVEKTISTKATTGSGNVDFQKDVDPWLGNNAGAAVLSVGGGKSDSKDKSGSSSGGTDAFAWADISDKAKFETFAKSQGLKKGSKVGDYDTWSKSGSYIAVKSDLAVFADSKSTLTKTVQYSGDSITSATGVKDVADQVGSSALAAVVVSGDGLRKALGSNSQLKSLAGMKQVKDLDAVSVSFGAEDQGMHLHAYSSGAKSTSTNVSNDVFRSLPGTTLLALGGQDLGGGIKGAVDQAGQSSAGVQRTVAQVTAALGVDQNELATAFSGEFALALGGQDADLQALIGGVAGAAMGKGLGSVKPASLVRSGSLTLAFANGTTTTETLDKLVGAVGGLTGSGAPKTGKQGDFQTKTFALQGVPVTAASSKDVAALSIGKDVFTGWGTNQLADNATFTDAWKAAGAPDKVGASFWLDWPRVAKLIGRSGGTGRTAGGWVGWSTSSGNSGTFDLFMHVKKS